MQQIIPYVIYIFSERIYELSFNILFILKTLLTEFQYSYFHWIIKQETIYILSLFVLAESL